MKKLLSIIAVAMVAIAVNADEVTFDFSNASFRSAHSVVNQTLTITQAPITFYAEDKTVQSEVVRGLEYGSDYLQITETSPLVRVSAAEGYVITNIMFYLKESAMGDVYGLQHHESIFGSEANNMQGDELVYNNSTEFVSYLSGVKSAEWKATKADEKMQVQKVVVAYEAAGATALDNASNDKVAVKQIHNGQFLIFREGARYNALGTVVE